jgi:hypothetical protein
MCRICGRGEACTDLRWENLRERDNWGDPDIERKIMLRRIFSKREGVVGTK